MPRRTHRCGRCAPSWRSCATRAGARDRDRDLLAFELDEIVALGPEPDEERSLLAERGRLRQIDGLRAAAGAGAEAITPDDGSAVGVSAALGEAERLADAVSGADPELDALAERLRALRIEADDLGADLRRYRAGSRPSPAGSRRSSSGSSSTTG